MRSDRACIQAREACEDGEETREEKKNRVKAEGFSDREKGREKREETRRDEFGVVWTIADTHNT